MVGCRSRGWKFGLLAVVSLLVTASCRHRKFALPSLPFIAGPIPIVFSDSTGSYTDQAEPTTVATNALVLWTNDTSAQIHVCVQAGLFSNTATDFAVPTHGNTRSGPVQASPTAQPYEYYIYQDAPGFMCPAQLGSGKPLVGPKHIIVQ